MKLYELLIMAPIFIVLLITIHEPVKAAFNFGNIGSWIFSACISALAISGMTNFPNSPLEIILLVYAAMAIAILVVLLSGFFFNLFKKAKDHLSGRIISKDDADQTTNNQLKRQQNVHRE